MKTDTEKKVLGVSGLVAINMWFPTVLSFIVATIAYIFNPSLADNKTFILLGEHKGHLIMLLSRKIF